MVVSTVKFRRSKLFNETLAKNRGLAGKVEEFIKFKTDDPMGRFGSKDQHFTGDHLGNIGGMIHARLTHDVSILYKRSGKNPIIIDLVAILSHDELGTGQPPNMRQQKKVAKQLDALTFESRKLIGFKRL